jgi:diadenosine tetraphosphatase ApaH/serine/threonine PP2A family protein phosphatase
MLGSRTIFVGDVHGCAEELKELIDKLELQGDDRIVFLGDLVDKGPSSVEVIRIVRGLACDLEIGGVVCIAGNHEADAIRKHEQGKEGEPWTREAAPDDWRFLESLPLLARFPELGVTAVHGGFFPKFWTDHPEGIGEIAEKWHRGGGKRMDRIRRFLRVRHVSQEDGDFVALGAEKPGDPHWSEVYDGREGDVFYGHDPLIGKVRLPKSEPGEGLRIFTGRAFGIDTGCVFGGALTAAIVRRIGINATGAWLDGQHTFPSFVSVPARKQYAEPLKTEDA